MGRMRVAQREVPALIARLRSEGVTEIRRLPARMDGFVDVIWKRDGEVDDLRLWTPAFILSGIISLVLIVAWLVYELTRAR